MFHQKQTLFKLLFSNKINCESLNSIYSQLHHHLLQSFLVLHIKKKYLKNDIKSHAYETQLSMEFLLTLLFCLLNNFSHPKLQLNFKVFFLCSNIKPQLWSTKIAYWYQLHRLDVDFIKKFNLETFSNFSHGIWTFFVCIFVKRNIALLLFWH